MMKRMAQRKIDSVRIICFIGIPLLRVVHRALSLPDAARGMMHKTWFKEAKPSGLVGTMKRMYSFPESIFHFQREE